MENLLKHPFLYYINKFKFSFLIGVIAVFITDLTDVLTPYILGKLLNIFQLQKNLEGTTSLFVIFVAVCVLNAFFRYLWRIYFAKFHHNVAFDLRAQCFKSYFKKDLSEFSQTATGDKMAIFTKDIENFRMAIGPGLLILIDGCLYLLMIPFLMWSLNPQWTVIVIFIAPIIPIIIALIEKNLNKLFDKQQEHLSNLSAIAQESLEGIKVIKSFRMEKIRQNFYDGESKKLFKLSTKLDFIHSSFSPVLEFFVSVSCALLLFYIAFKQSDINNIQIGTLFAFYQYMQRLTWPLTALGISYMMVAEGRASFKRISKTLATTTKNEPLADLNFITKVQDLDFYFENKSDFYFKDLNLTLEKNKSYLITGKTKSGKSTLMNLLSGLLSAKKGTVSVEKKSLILNPQIPFLFMDSVYNNIHHEIKAFPEEFEKIAFYNEYINLNKKGDTLVGEKGTNLSGGQKQRLSLLRALKSHGKTLFLDEPLSAVDETTKQALIKTLQEEKKAGRNFVIATSSPEYFTWIENTILVEEKNKSLRSVTSLSTASALKNPQFQSLVNAHHREEFYE